MLDLDVLLFDREVAVRAQLQHPVDDSAIYPSLKGGPSGDGEQFIMKFIPLQVHRDDPVAQVPQHGYQHDQHQAAKLGFPAFLRHYSAPFPHRSARNLGLIFLDFRIHFEFNI